MKKGKEEKTKFSKILPNNQIITAYRIELRVQEMTMNQKLTMIGLMELCMREYAIITVVQTTKMMLIWYI